MSIEVEFESKTNPKWFWWGHLEMLLLLNLIVGCDKLSELVFERK